MTQLSTRAAFLRLSVHILLLAGLTGIHSHAFAQLEITQPAAAKPAAAASASAAATPPAAPAANPAAPKPFKEVIKDAKEHKGFYTLWQKDEKVWMEIRPEQFGKQFFFSNSVANAVGERGLYASSMDGSHHAEFRKIGNQVQLVAKNMAFYATPGTPQAHALAQGFSDSLLSSAPVASAPHPESKGVLIELNALLFNDIIGYSTDLEHAFRMSFALDKVNTSISKINVDDKLTGVLVNNHFSVPRIAAPPLTPPPTPATPPPANLPDARSLFVGVYYNFMPLPEQAMRPRIADDRIGHFVTSIDDYTDDTTVKTKRHFVNRWRLEKADSTAAVSEPKQPITFWLDKNIPEKYRKSITEGVLLWNLAFEKIGFKNAIVVKQQAEADTFDTMDSRHASIRWVMGSDVSFARGPSVKDARSGEILDADIMMSDGFGRGARVQVAEEFSKASTLANSHTHDVHGEECHFAAGAAAELDFAFDVLEARGDMDMNSPEAEALAQAYVKKTIAHEVGHTLGLRHNFRASTVYTAAQLQDKAFTQANGTTASIMDYIPFNLAVKGEQQGEYMSSTIGPYDYWAIEYAYKPIDPANETEELARIAARSTEPWLAYSSDEDARIGALSDPAVNQFDLGSDPLAYVQKRLTISRELWDRAHKRQLKDGESYETLRRNVSSGLRQFARTVQIATKYIGGTTTLRDHAGTGRPTFTPVPAAQQRQALQMVTDTLFSARNFVFTPELLSRMGSDQTTYATPRTMLSPTAVLLTTQTAALDQLMSDTVAARALGSVELAKNPKEVLSLNELYGTLQSSIWSELGGATDITSFRRDLQREHVKRVAQAIIKPSGATRADARSLQRQHAISLLAKIRLAAGRMKSAEARAHLTESEVMLAEALKAPLMRSAL